jgi:hypothetical protein
MKLSSLEKSIIGTGFLLFVIGSIDSINFTVDDTFIPMRYAENFVKGKGLVFNEGEFVEGYSSLPWTIMLSFFVKAGISQNEFDFALVQAAKLAGIFFGFCTLIVLAYFTILLKRVEAFENDGWMLSLAVLGTGATFSFSLWSVAGLETSLCALVATVAATLYFLALQRLEKTGSFSRPLFYAGSVAFGFLSWVRPEQIFIWALTVAVTSLFLPERTRKALVVSAVPTVIIYGVQLLWRWNYYDALLPNTVNAKVGWALQQHINGMKYALGGLISTTGVLGISYLALPSLVRRGIHWKFLAFFSAAFILFAATSGGDWMPGYRFLVPVMPILWVMTIAALILLQKSLSVSVSRWIVVSLVLFLAGGSFFNERRLVRALHEYPTGFKEITWYSARYHYHVAKRLQELIPANSLLALGECGLIPYFNPDIRIMDNFGLMDRNIAMMPGIHTSKLTTDYFFARNPDFCLVMVEAYDSLESGDPQPTHPDGRILMSSQDFRMRYEIARRFPRFVLFKRR